MEHVKLRLHTEKSCISLQISQLHSSDMLFCTPEPIQLHVQYYCKIRLLITWQSFINLILSINTSIMD